MGLRDVAGLGANVEFGGLIWGNVIKRTALKIDNKLALYCSAFTGASLNGGLAMTGANDSAYGVVLGIIECVGVIMKVA